MPVFAVVSITEIMYDAPGTDTKHEWVEVYNDGPPVDLSTWKFFENSSNHGLTLHAGSAIVGTSGYAIISDDAATFVTDFPSYAGAVFDASFSLSNTGETLTLRDSSLSDISTATYASTAGAAGDGTTLNFVSGSWVPRTASPGTAAASGGAPPPSGGGSTPGSHSSSSSGSAASGSTGAESEVPKITVDAGADRAVVVGAGSVFTGVVYGTKGTPIANARYVWNLGNGTSREGKSVLYAYTLPGTYTVTLDASSEGWAVTDRITVTAIAADIVVTRASNAFIEIENRTTHELDIGLWQLATQGKNFVLPTHTILLARTSIVLPFETTGLAAQSAKEVTLLYPNGVLAAGPAPEVLFESSKSSPPLLSPAQADIKVPVAGSEKNVSTVELRDRTATALESQPRDGGGADVWLWFGSLGFVVLLGSGALFALRSRWMR